jgi:hypothetical protein
MRALDKLGAAMNGGVPQLQERIAAASICQRDSSVAPH